MPKITRIEYKADRERYWIFVDSEYCTSIRARTFPTLDLTVGQTISCEQIKELESHHWKHSYGQPVEKFVFIKPNPKKRYAVSEMEIRGSIELYVEFSDSDQEVVPMEHFRNHLMMKVNQ